MSKRSSSPRPALATEPAPWQRLLLVCSKCMKRQDRESLRGDFKRALRNAGLRDVRVVTVSCFDLCPDDGVALAFGDDLGGAVPRLRVLSNSAEPERVLPLLLGD